jgi:hypothetical protein
MIRFSVERILIEHDTECTISKREKTQTPLPVASVIAARPPSRVIWAGPGLTAKTRKRTDAW